MAAFVAAVVGADGAARAQERDPPFEPVPKHVLAAAQPPREPSGFSPAADVMLPLIGVYRSDIGPKSIARCPYVVSCSRFAHDAIERYGFWGLLVFVDRYLFRENPAAWGHYEIVRLDDGTLRLDDGAER